MKWFEMFHPLRGQMAQVLDPQGRITDPGLVFSLPDEEVLSAYHMMVYSRTMSTAALSFQHQGRARAFPATLGLEAVSVSVGRAMQDSDWLAPACRGIGSWLACGVSPRDYYLYSCDEQDNFSPFSHSKRLMASRRLFSAQERERINAIQLRGDSGIVFSCWEDGETLGRDFCDEMMEAVHWNMPVILIVHNDREITYMSKGGQSCPRSSALTALRFGMDGIQVDGNDYLAMYMVLRESRARVSSGRGPVLIEAMTDRYRVPTRPPRSVRDETFVDDIAWTQRDPVFRLKIWLKSKNLLDERAEAELAAKYRDEADLLFSEFMDVPAFVFPNSASMGSRKIPREFGHHPTLARGFFHWKTSRA